MNTGESGESKPACGAYTEPPGISIEPIRSAHGAVETDGSIAMNKKVAVILSGCGVYDGSEIYERHHPAAHGPARRQVQCFAPNIAQMHVINHLTGEEMPESRNVLTESARLARGEIRICARHAPRISTR